MRQLLLYAVQVLAIIVSLVSIALVQHGQWLWAALLPVAVAAFVWTTKQLPRSTREPLEYYPTTTKSLDLSVYSSPAPHMTWSARMFFVVGLIVLLGLPAYLVALGLGLVR
jgi:hypothetical protein